MSDYGGHCGGGGEGGGENDHDGPGCDCDFSSQRRSGQHSRGRFAKRQGSMER